MAGVNASWIVQPVRRTCLSFAEHLADAGHAHGYYRMVLNMNADARLAVLLAHLAPNQSPASLQPGSRDESRWVIASSGALVIVGGICLDIQAQPNDVDVQRGTSVPGKVRQVPGGVGRNMAEALSILVPADRPAPVFISLVGDDTAGSFLTTSLRRLRLDLSHLMTCPGAPTPCVSAVLERAGEVAACVADVTSVEQLLTAERLRECGQQIQQACLVLAEGNLSADALTFVSRTASLAGVPVFLEPTSVPKAARLVPSLPYATFVSPNAAELMSMADEVRRARGLPLLPRPTLPDGPAQDGGRGQEGGAGIAATGSDLEPSELVSELLRQLATFAEVVLLQGTSCVVLTLGSLGAALITLCGAAAAPAAAPPPPLEPLAASSSTGCGPSSLGSSSNNHGGLGHPGFREGGSWVPVGLRAPATALNKCSAFIAVPSASLLPAPTTTALPQVGSGPSAPGRTANSASGASHPAAPSPAAAARPGGQEGGHNSPAAQGLVTAPLARQAAPVVPAPGPLPPAATRRQPQQQRGAVAVVHLRALPAEVVSVNGAGDTLVAGMVAALLQQQEPVRALAHGMAAARRAVESQKNVPDLEFAALRPDADKILATAQRHLFPLVLGPS